MAVSINQGLQAGDDAAATAQFGSQPAAITAYVINLDRSPDRWALAEPQLREAGIPFERVPAIDGATLGDPPWPGVDAEKYRRNMGRGFSANEVACTYSHMAALERFQRGQSSFGLILEDDFKFKDAKTFPRLVQALLAGSSDWDVVRLASTRSPLPVGRRQLSAGYTLAAPLLKTPCAVAYLVNRRGADAILRSMKPITGGYDHQLDRPWLYPSIRYRVVSPTPVAWHPKIGSTIAYRDSEKYPPLQRLPALIYRMRNGINRLLYNLAHLLFVFDSREDRTRD